MQEHDLSFISFEEELLIENPAYFQQLSYPDQEEYHKLKEKIHEIVERNGRSRFCKGFGEIVNKIKSYIVKGDQDDAKRSLVCGILWLDNDSQLALNTKELCFLIGKCKSTVNAGFQSLGYKTSPINPESAAKLAETFPFLKERFEFARKWTLRIKTEIPKKPKPKSKARQVKNPSPQTNHKIQPKPFVIPTVELNLPEPEEAFCFDFVDDGDNLFEPCIFDEESFC